MASPVAGWFFSTSRQPLQTSLYFSSLGIQGFWSPPATTALRFLDPITVPMPARPATRSCEKMAANLTRFSPAGPMTIFPIFLGSFSCVFSVSRPHRCEASSMETSPFSIFSQLGLGALPRTIRASKPERLRCTPKLPPLLELTIRPVAGDLEVTLNLLVLGAPVPVMAAVVTMRMFSGLIGSTPGGRSS